MPDQKNDIAAKLKRELLLAVMLFVGGVLLLPAAVYAVGALIFGEYPNGPTGFYGEIWSALARGNPATWFLVASPLLVVVVVRLTWYGMRRPRRREPA